MNELDQHDHLRADLDNCIPTSCFSEMRRRVFMMIIYDKSIILLPRNPPSRQSLATFFGYHGTRQLINIGSGDPIVIHFLPRWRPTCWMFPQRPTA